MTENTTENKNSGVPAELSGIVKITYLDKSNTTLTEKNGFLGLRAIVDKPDDPLLAEKDEKKDEKKDGDGKKDEKSEKSEEKVHYPEEDNLPEGKILKVADRIYLSRAFPFDMPHDYISVLDKDKKEIGFIRSLDDFDEPQKSMLLRELDAKYYTPTIKKILSVKERYGFSYWKTECEFGEKSFTLQDTYRSIIKATNPDGSERLFILDVDGNRYEIPDVEKLDRQSFKKIELYL